MRLKKAARKFENALGSVKGSTTFALEHAPASTDAPWRVRLSLSGKDMLFDPAGTPRKAVRLALRVLGSAGPQVEPAKPTKVVAKRESV